MKRRARGSPCLRGERTQGRPCVAAPASALLLAAWAQHGSSLRADGFAPSELSGDCPFLGRLNEGVEYRAGPVERNPENTHRDFGAPGLQMWSVCLSLRDALKGRIHVGIVGRCRRHRARIETNSHFGANAGRADTRRRGAGDTGRRRGFRASSGRARFPQGGTGPLALLLAPHILPRVLVIARASSAQLCVAAKCEFISARALTPGSPAARSFERTPETNPHSNRHRDPSDGGELYDTGFVCPPRHICCGQSFR